VARLPVILSPIFFKTTAAEPMATALSVGLEWAGTTLPFLAAATGFALLRVSLQHSNPTRVLARLRSDEKRARLEPLLRLRGLAELSDEAMVNAQRANLLDSAAPNPSVETLLHAFLPHKFVDHTHSVAAVSIADQPKVEEICRRIYDERMACVPYILPGFRLAKAAGAVFDAHPKVEGLMLGKHGLFTFGATARQSYERMIEFVTLAENHIGATSRPRPRAKPVARPQPKANRAEPSHSETPAPLDEPPGERCALASHGLYGLP